MKFKNDLFLRKNFRIYFLLSLGVLCLWFFTKNNERKVVVVSEGKEIVGIKVGTYNIWHNSWNWRIRLKEIVESVRKENFDVIGFQEVRIGTQFNQMRDLSDQLNVLGYTEFVYAPAMSWPDNTTEGVALFSKHKIIFSQMVPLSFHFRKNFSLNISDSNRRVALFIRILFNQKNKKTKRKEEKEIIIDILNTHFSTDVFEQCHNFRDLISIVRHIPPLNNRNIHTNQENEHKTQSYRQEEDTSIIILGDLNLFEDKDQKVRIFTNFTRQLQLYSRLNLIFSYYQVWNQLNNLLLQIQNNTFSFEQENFTSNNPSKVSDPIISPMTKVEEIESPNTHSFFIKNDIKRPKRPKAINDMCFKVPISSKISPLYTFPPSIISPSLSFSVPPHITIQPPPTYVLSTDPQSSPLNKTISSQQLPTVQNSSSTSTATATPSSTTTTTSSSTTTTTSSSTSINQRFPKVRTYLPREPKSYNLLSSRRNKVFTDIRKQLKSTYLSFSTVPKSEFCSKNRDGCGSSGYVSLPDRIFYSNGTYLNLIPKKITTGGGGESYFNKYYIQILFERIWKVFTTENNLEGCQNSFSLFWCGICLDKDFLFSESFFFQPEREIIEEQQQEEEEGKRSNDIYNVNYIKDPKLKMISQKIEEIAWMAGMGDEIEEIESIVEWGIYERIDKRIIEKLKKFRNEIIPINEKMNSISKRIDTLNKEENKTVFERGREYFQTFIDRREGRIEIMKEELLFIKGRNQWKSLSKEKNSFKRHLVPSDLHLLSVLPSCPSISFLEIIFWCIFVNIFLYTIFIRRIFSTYLLREEEKEEEEQQQYRKNKLRDIGFSKKSNLQFTLELRHSVWVIVFFICIVYIIYWTVINYSEIFSLINSSIPPEEKVPSDHLYISATFSVIFPPHLISSH